MRKAPVETPEAVLDGDDTIIKKQKTGKKKKKKKGKKKRNSMNITVGDESYYESPLEDYDKLKQAAIKEDLNENNVTPPQASLTEPEKPKVEEKKSIPPPSPT